MKTIGETVCNSVSSSIWNYVEIPVCYFIGNSVVDSGISVENPVFNSVGRSVRNPVFNSVDELIKEQTK